MRWIHSMKEAVGMSLQKWAGPLRTGHCASQSLVGWPGVRANSMAQNMHYYTWPRGLFRLLCPVNSLSRVAIFLRLSCSESFVSVDCNSGCILELLEELQNLPGQPVARRSMSLFPRVTAGTSRADSVTSCLQAVLKETVSSPLRWFLLLNILPSSSSLSKLYTIS